MKYLKSSIHDPSKTHKKMADPDPMFCDPGSLVYDPDPVTVIPDPIYLVTTITVSFIDSVKKLIGYS